MTKKTIITIIITTIILIVSPALGFLLKYKIMLLHNECISKGENNVCHINHGCGKLNNGLIIYVKGYKCRCQGSDNLKPASQTGLIADGWPKGWHCFKKK